jgi:antirestriction protein
MSITLTVNYKETLNTETVEKIDELLDENYALDDMLEFIDEYNENDFVAYYEEYVRCGEAIGYDAVDAFIEEMGSVSDIEGCDERFRGWYESTADFAEQFTEEIYGDVPSHVVVDWEATYDNNLRYDYTACEKGYRQVAIFSDY